MKENIEQVSHFQSRFPKLIREIKVLDEVLDDAGGNWTSDEMGVIFTDVRIPQNPDTQKPILNTKGMKKVAFQMYLRQVNAGLKPMADHHEKKIREKVYGKTPIPSK